MEAVCPSETLVYSHMGYGATPQKTTIHTIMTVFYYTDTKIMEAYDGL
jgi:hypothetical protein